MFPSLYVFCCIPGIFYLVCKREEDKRWQLICVILLFCYIFLRFWACFVWYNVMCRQMKHAGERHDSLRHMPVHLWLFLIIFAEMFQTLNGSFLPLNVTFVLVLLTRRNVFVLFTVYLFLSWTIMYSIHNLHIVIGDLKNIVLATLLPNFHPKQPKGI